MEVNRTHVEELGNLPVGRQLKLIRQIRGLRQNHVARGVGITPGYLSRIENRESDFDFNTAKRIAEHLGCKLSISIEMSN